MKQLLRMTDSSALYRHYDNKLTEKFRYRGYSKRILREVKCMTHSRRRQELRKLKRKRRIERLVPFVTTFEKYDPPLNKLLCTKWENICEDHKFYSLLLNARFAVYGNKRSLGSLMFSNRRMFNTQRYIPNLKLGASTEFKFMQFNHHHHLTRQ